MKKRVLAVDDEEPIQELIKVYLSPLNVKVYQAFTGEDGVKMYENMFDAGRRPDLVIMDLKLPGIDGIEAIKRIMKIDPWAVIYGFTAFSSPIWASQMLEAGAKKVIPRSMGFSGLRGMVQETLMRKKIAIH
ncbi:MAG: response regulator [Candidatus Thermoplasmatota archaeon]|nr:response regulator [Candidatus Thermoplasmatota archaeon]